jgi:excisionase family DNA binding protein
MPDRLVLTIQEAAHALRVHRRTIVRWIKAGNLAAIQIRPRGAVRVLLPATGPWAERTMAPPVVAGGPRRQKAGT